MTGRRGEHDAATQRAIGDVVREARAAGVRWKALERRFDRCRRQLSRYAGRVAAQDVSKNPQDVTTRALRVLLGGSDDRGSFQPVLSFAERDPS